MTTPLPYGYQDPLSNVETLLQLWQNNDAILTFTITDPNNSGAFINLTGATITFYRKLNRFTPDSKAITYNGVINVNPATGICTVAIPGTDNVTPSVSWWHLDVLQAGQTRTASFGPLRVVAV